MDFICIVDGCDHARVGRSTLCGYHLSLELFLVSLFAVVAVYSILHVAILYANNGFPCRDSVRSPSPQLITNERRHLRGGVPNNDMGLPRRTIWPN